MSKVIEQSAAVEQQTVETPSQIPPNYDQRVSALSGEALHHWELTGDLDAAETKTKPDAKAAPSPALSGAPDEDAAQTEPDSDPGEPVQQPISRRDRDWSNLRKAKDQAEREAIALKAKLEFYESERAASRNSAPAATQEAPKPQSDRPKRPRLSDFQDVDSYESALDQYEDKAEAWRLVQIEQRTAQYEAQQSEAQLNRTWGERVTSAKSKYKDFADVAFSANVPASFASIPRLQQHADGADIAYYLGKNLDAAGKLAELTTIPGVLTDEQFAQFVRRAENDPKAARVLARVEALADAEFDRIAESLRKPAVESKPKATPPKPTSEVSVTPRGSAVEDEELDALKRGDFPTYERIANAREIRERRGF